MLLPRRHVSDSNVKFQILFLRVIALSGISLALSGLAASQITGVVPLASSSQVPGFNGELNTVTENGLTETSPGSGQFQLSTSQVGWTSAGGDVSGALIHFDFGSIKTVNRFRVWNYNEPNFLFRGFREVNVQYSDDALVWKTTPQTFAFPQAPGTSVYLG